MDEIKAGLQYAFQTESKYTLLISGTGHAGMELCLANMLEPGQKVVIGNNGTPFIPPIKTFILSFRIDG